METWKDIIGFEGLYSVSTHGNVRRDAPTRGFGSRVAPGRHLRQKRCADGYRSVSIYPARGCQKQIHVHRLVAAAFIGSVPDGHVVNHKDGNKSNNVLENLEYVTPSQNTKHAFAIGLMKGKKGEANSMAKINDDTIRAIKILAYEHSWSNNAIARAMCMDPAKVGRILEGKIWPHVLYAW